MTLPHPCDGQDNNQDKSNSVICALRDQYVHEQKTNAVIVSTAVNIYHNICKTTPAKHDLSKTSHSNHLYILIPPLN